MRLGGHISRADTLLILTDADSSRAGATMPGLLRFAGAPVAATANHGEAVADWLGIDLPASAAALRLRAEAGAKAGHEDDCFGAMDPVCLGADMRELHMLEPLPELSEREAVSILAAIEPSLSARGITALAATPERWYALSNPALRFDAAAPHVVACDRVLAHMPSGPDGRLLRGLMNEIQMQLHDNEVNLERAQRGAAPINSVWFWGGARAPDKPMPLPRMTLPPLYSADPLLVGLWLAMNGEIREPARAGETGPILRSACVATLTLEAAVTAGLEKLVRRRRLRLVLADGVVRELSPWRPFLRRPRALWPR